jgi:hypothetical protein
MSRLVKSSIPRNSRPRADQPSHHGNQYYYDEEPIPNEAYNEAFMREHQLLANNISQRRHSLYADEAAGVRQSYYTCSDSDESCSTAPAERSRVGDCDDQENVPDHVDEEEITNYIRRNFQVDDDMEESESDRSDIRRYVSRSDDVEESDSEEDTRRYASRSDYWMNPENPDSDSDSYSSSQSSYCVEQSFLSQSAPDISESDDDAHALVRGMGRPTISSASSFQHSIGQSRLDSQPLQGSRHRGRGRSAFTTAASSSSSSSSSSSRTGSGNRSLPGQSSTDSSSGTYSMKEAPLRGHGGRPTLERANSCEGEFSYRHTSGDVDREERHSLHAYSFHAQSAGRVRMRSGDSSESRSTPKPDGGRWLAKQISQRSLSGLGTSSHHDPPAMNADEMESSSSGESFGGDLESGFEGYGESVADAHEESSVSQSDDDQGEFKTHGVAGLRTSSHHDDQPAMDTDEMESSSSGESSGNDLKSGFDGFGESVAGARERPSVIAQSDDDQGEFKTRGVAGLRSSSHQELEEEEQGQDERTTANNAQQKEEMLSSLSTEKKRQPELMQEMLIETDVDPDEMERQKELHQHQSIKEQQPNEKQQAKLRCNGEDHDVGPKTTEIRDPIEPTMIEPAMIEHKQVATKPMTELAPSPTSEKETKTVEESSTKVHEIQVNAPNNKEEDSKASAVAVPPSDRRPLSKAAVRDAKRALILANMHRLDKTLEQARRLTPPIRSKTGLQGRC